MSVDAPSRNRMSHATLVVVCTGIALSVASLTTAPLAAQTGQWVEPVAAPVVDGYRPPAHVGAPGNRGWEYATDPGTVVVAAGPGVVVFAGPIGGSAYISVQHADGRRTTYSHVATIGVEVGDVVAVGAPIGASGDRLHFGVRVGSEYRDPGELFDGSTAPGTGFTLDVGGGLRLIPSGERRATAPTRSGGIDRRSAPAPTTWFGQWVTMREPALRAPVSNADARGWSAVATDTLADGPGHSAPAP